MNINYIALINDFFNLSSDRIKRSFIKKQINFYNTLESLIENDDYDDDDYYKRKRFMNTFIFKKKLLNNYKTINSIIKYCPNVSNEYIIEVSKLITPDLLKNENGLSDLYVNKIARNEKGEYGIINIDNVFYFKIIDGRILNDLRGEIIFQKFFYYSNSYINNCLNIIKKDTDLIIYTKIENNSKNNDIFLRKVTLKLNIDYIKNEKPLLKNKEQLSENKESMDNKNRQQLIENILKEHNNLNTLLTIENIKKCDDTQLSILFSKLQTLPKILNVLKKKKVKINHILTTQVWNEYIGIEIGQIKCPVCKVNEINQRNFECGHVISEIKGGETKLENLRPLCNKCNKSIGTNEMDKTLWNNIKLN